MIKVNECLVYRILQYNDEIENSNGGDVGLTKLFGI